MKSKLFLCLLLIVGLSILAACEVQSDASSMYKKEQPLQVSFMSPGEYEKHQKEKIQFEVLQNEKKAQNLQFVHVSIWSSDRAFNVEMVEANLEQDGSYSLDVDFPKDGLYYVQIHTANETEVITPTRRTLVGKLSKADSEKLQSNTPTAGGSSGHQH